MENYINQYEINTEIIADTEGAETLELESILPLDDPTASKTEETK